MNPFSGENIRTDTEEVVSRQLSVRIAVGIVEETQRISQGVTPESLPQSGINEENVIRENVISLAERRRTMAVGGVVGDVAQSDHTAEARQNVAEAFEKAA